MLRFNALFVLLFACVSPVAATEPVANLFLPIPADDRLGQADQRVRLDDGQIVTNRAILGPSQDLLEPHWATQLLHGTDYAEWCLRWNRLQYYQAKQRAIPPRRISGHVSTYRSFADGSSRGTYWRPISSTRRYLSTSRSREEIWDIGGYGGGPVTIYNPFVTR